MKVFSAGAPVTDEDAMLQKALAMSMETEDVNLEAMTEEEQIQYAMKMSMADQAQEVCEGKKFLCSDM